MRNVVILGTGAFAREALSFLQPSNEYRIIGFTDPSSIRKGILINDIPVLGDDNLLERIIRQNVTYAFVAVSEIATRKVLFRKICDIGFKPINIVHPSAVVASDVSLGQGVVIYPNVTINTNVNIGNSVIINSNVSIGHDVEIGDFVNINPGVDIAGKVKIEESAFLGMGASILENVVIRRMAIVGAAALVRKDVLPETTVVGVPAQEIRHKTDLQK